MTSVASNVVRLVQRRYAVHAVPLIDAEHSLQMAILAWLERTETPVSEFLDDPTVYGRSSLVFETKELRLLNEAFLRRRLDDPDRVIALGRALMEVVGPTERPRALQFTAVSDGTSGQFAVLPATIEGTAVNVLRLTS